MDRSNWAELVRNIEQQRHTLFFKPVCVIAALDLANEGELDPRDIIAKKIVERFAKYVRPIDEKRADRGHQPLWPLANDCLWTFYKEGRLLTARTLKQKAPSWSTLRREADRLEIHSTYQKLWAEEIERKSLRDQMLHLLYSKSGKDGRRFAAALFDPAKFDDQDQWASTTQLDEYFARFDTQFPLSLEHSAAENTPAPSAESPTPTPREGSDLSPARTEALQRLPSPIDYIWLHGRLATGPNSAVAPIFPTTTSAYDHGQRLETCRALTARLISAISNREFQIRDTYKEELEFYLLHLPSTSDIGNILIADATISFLRELHDREDHLPETFSLKLKSVIKNYYGLRVFYPETERFHIAAKAAQIVDSLPMDAVNDIIEVVKRFTPDLFDRSVPGAIDETVRDETTLSPVGHFSGSNSMALPPDPLGEVDASQASALQIASALNRLWTVFKAGETNDDAAKRWADAYKQLSGPMKAIIDWLLAFLGQ